MNHIGAHSIRPEMPIIGMPQKTAKKSNFSQ